MACWATRRPCGDRANLAITLMSFMAQGIPGSAQPCLMGRMPTGAQVIVKELEAAGVEVCFGLPGVHNLALWEALRDSPIRLVGVRHEQAAAYAADGYARATVAGAVVDTADGRRRAMAQVTRPHGGPAYLEVPTDLLAADAEGPEADAPAPLPGFVAAGEAAYRLIEEARQPLIWAGGGARDRADEVRALAERLAAPVLTTYGGGGE